MSPAPPPAPSSAAPAPSTEPAPVPPAPVPPYRLKDLPEDFVVEERLALVPDASGPFALWRLEKRGRTTEAALEGIARASGLPPEDLRAAGKKDRNALTVQYFSAPAGRALRSPEEAVRIERVGFVPAPLAPGAIGGNRFRILLRGLEPALARACAERAAPILAAGFANHFGDQRFAGTGIFRARDGRPEGIFPAERILKGQIAGALRAWLAAPRGEAEEEAERRRRRFEEGWGDFAGLMPLARTRRERAILERLAADSSRRGQAEALRLVSREEWSMSIAAYQGFLFGETLNRLIRRSGAPFAERPGRVAPRLHPADPEAEAALLEGIGIPTVAARLVPGSPEAEAILAEVLAERGLSLSRFNLRVLRSAHFESFLRPARVRTEATVASPGPDPRTPGRQALEIAFFLPRGAYATVALEGLFAALVGRRRPSPAPS